MAEAALIIAVAGLPSSGKGTFSEIAIKYGFKRFVMGDVIRSECKQRGLDVTRANSDFVMVDLRKQKGQNAVAVITLEWVLQAMKEGHNYILIDGIRSMPEINYFKQHLDNLIIIGIHASQEERLRRAMLRKRIDDAYSIEAFMERDNIELSIGLGDVLARSDILVNAEGDLETTQEYYQQVLMELTEGVIYVH